MPKTLTEWYEENQNDQPTIMKVVSQSIDQQEPEQFNEPEKEPEFKEDVKKASGLLKMILNASLLKSLFEELLKINDENLTKEYKDDIIDKIDKLKQEVEKL